jgi:hypothetical protein
MHKTRIRLDLCFNKPIREKKNVSHTKLELDCTYVSTFNTTIGLNLEVICAGEHCIITHTALEALMCTRRIAEKTTSCYMLLRVNPFRS